MKKFFCSVAAAMIIISSSFLISRDCQKLITLAEVLIREGISKLELVFEDYFDTLDERVWTKVVGVRNGGFWSGNQVFVEDGKLIIRAEHRPDGEYGDGYYTGAVNTSKSHEFKYGYFETRCKPTPACGVWSAFWLLCAGVEDETDYGRNGAEIDIFEAAYYGFPSGLRDYVVSGVHYDGYKSAHKGQFCVPYRVNNLHGEFHTFSLLWTETSYVFFIDGLQYWNVKNPKAISQVPEFMKLSSEVGGKNGNPNNRGNINTWSGDIRDNEEGTLPADFVIDYVKVFKFA